MTGRDDGRAAELALQDEIREAVDALEREGKHLARLARQAERLPSYRAVVEAWRRGDPCVVGPFGRGAGPVAWHSLAWQLRDALKDHVNGGPFAQAVADLRHLAELTPESIAAEQQRLAEERAKRERESEALATVPLPPMTLPPMTPKQQEGARMVLDLLSGRIKTQLA